MTPELTRMRDELAKQQGINHANPIIRSMYPSTSRTDMATQFAQLHSLGFTAAHDLLMPVIAKLLKCNLEEAEELVADEL